MITTTGGSNYLPKQTTLNQILKPIADLDLNQVNITNLKSGSQPSHAVTYS